MLLLPVVITGLQPAVSCKDSLIGPVLNLLSEQSNEGYETDSGEDPFEIYYVHMYISVCIFLGGLLYHVSVVYILLNLLCNISLMCVCSCITHGFWAFLTIRINKLKP